MVSFNNYNAIDVILWTVGLFLSVVSILFAVLAYLFSSKSTRLLQEHIEKTWLITETNKLFFEKMKHLKRSCNKIIFSLKREPNITYHKYNLISAGSRITHVNKEAVEIFAKTKFQPLITYYLQEKDKFDLMFFEIIEIEKVIANSNDRIPKVAIEQLIDYHNKLLAFGSQVLKMFTNLTI